MIRINLLPVKAAKRREQGQRQLFFGAVIVTVTVVGIIVLHTAEASRLSDLTARNTEISNVIANLKREMGDYDEQVRLREELMRQRDAIRRLQANRSGPVWMMREISDIFTKNKGPTFNREQYEETLKKDPNAGFNPNWEPKRAWILSYEEKGHNVKIRGAAKSDEDVAELLKRLKQSAFFSDVYWQQTQPANDAKLNVSYVTFDVTCRVNY